MPHRLLPDNPSSRSRLSGVALCLVIGLLASDAVVVTRAAAPVSRDPAQLRAGLFLYAAPRIADPRFAETVVLLIKHDRDGSLGLVVNQPSDVSLGKVLPEVPEARRSEVPVYWGGPVQPEATIALLRDVAPGPRMQRVLPGVHLATDREDVRAALSLPRPERAIRVYSGYAGWARAQLATEVRSGSWVLDEADAASVFAPDPTTLWEKVYEILQRRVARGEPDGGAGPGYVPRRMRGASNDSSKM